MKRVQVLLEEEEMAAFRRLANRSGLSFSAWLRQAGREKQAAEVARDRLATAADLERFFAECDRRETGREPDWHEHLAVIANSRLSGA